MGLSWASGWVREGLSGGALSLLLYTWKTQEKENTLWVAGNEGWCRRSI